MTTGSADGRNPSMTAKFVEAVRESYDGIDRLTPVTGRPGLGSYVRQLWQRRHFIWWQSRSRVITSNDDSRLGSVWLVLRPLLDAVFYWLIFGVLLQFDRGMDNFVAFVIIGVFMYQFTSTALTAGTRTISSNLSLTRAFQFPRMALPVADLIFDIMQRMLAVLVMFALIMLIPPHETPEWTWLLFPVLMLVQSVFDFGLMLIMARISTKIPDLTKLMQFVTRLLMYGSGVIFPIERLTANHPALHAIVELNPVFVLLSMYREILIDGTVPGPEHWIMLLCWTAGVFVVGFFMFWLGEEEYGREQNR